MPDLSCVYTLTTPGGTIVFNDGTFGLDDQFCIQDIQGLSGAAMRAPQDDVPYGDGGLSYNWWKTARHVVIDGCLLILSVPCGNAMNILRNQMEEDLRVALESIGGLTTDTGTLVWTPAGQSQHSLTVRYEVQLECPPDQSYLVRNFHFGLYSEAADWS